MCYKVGLTTYEVSDWIIDGYTRGSHYTAARAGRIVWHMLTKSKRQKCYPSKPHPKCIYSIWA